MGTGVPLGVDKTFDYEEYALPRIGTGTIIALVTDGMWESVNIRGEMFGKKRLHHIIREHANASSQQIVDNVFLQLSEFTEGLPCQDDLTLVIIKAV